LQGRDVHEDRKVRDPASIELLKKMFIYDPKRRITIQEILNDPYLVDQS
jgi:serine/threonine protein kinase